MTVDALMSPRVAADLCEVPTAFVLELVEAGIVKPVRVRGNRFVSLKDVELAIAETRELARSLDLGFDGPALANARDRV